MSEREITAQVLSEDGDLLRQVIQCWRENSEMLGFFPEGAFREHARQGHILAAVSGDDSVVGYLAYRIVRSDAIIVHLCVAPTHRKKGVGRLLVEALQTRTQSLDGIRLACRREFAAGVFWERLGFVPCAERPGRAKKGSTLTVWRLDYGRPDMFADSHSQATGGKLSVVLDTNVVADLQDGPERDSEESKALVADWVQESLDLCVTDEALVDFYRAGSRKERQRRRAFLGNFTMLRAAPDDIEREKREVLSVISVGNSPSEQSDIAHLAKTLAARRQIFVTRDQTLLQKASILQDQLGLRVLRPSGVIVYIDELQREAEYQPERLGGGRLAVKRVGTGMLAQLEQQFLGTAFGEKKTDFHRVLSACVADPRRVDTRVVLNERGEAIAVIAHDSSQEFQMSIPLFRISRGTLRDTLARALISDIESMWPKRGSVTLIEFSDKTALVDDAIRAALRENRFSAQGDSWYRISLKGLYTTQTARAALDTLRLQFPSIDVPFQKALRALDLISGRDKPGFVLSAESLLWPGKIIGNHVPCFIMSIQPKWAEHLFDRKLARQSLFGGDTRLFMAQENVYYRFPKPGIVRAPARVLWYVSDSGHHYGSKAIRAASAVTNVECGLPKDIFRRYRRLGVFNWFDIMEITHDDCDQEIMAIRFRNTELFRQAIEWKQIQEILVKNRGKRSQFQSPLGIDETTYAEVYAHGFGIN